MIENIKGWIIYPKTKCSMNDSSYSWIIQEAKKEEIDLEILFIEELSCVVNDGGLYLLNKGKKIDHKPSFALMRGYDFSIMRHIELMGVKLFNNHMAMSNSFDKLITHQILVSQSIPTVKTISNCRDYSILANFFGNKRFIVKYPKGSKGNEVYLINSKDEFDLVSSKYDEVISQEFIEVSYGKDIRVWVIGDKAVGAVMRFNDNSFKSNFSQGGQVKKIEITSEIEKIAVKSSLAMGLDFSGVDLLFSNNGYVVCEVNGNAAFRSLGTFNEEIVIPKRLFEFIKGNVARNSW